jgi:outer membrane lipoprotein-sorting protein
MLGKCKLRGFLYTLVFFALALGAQTKASNEDQAARDKGWKLLQQAREAFRAGGAPASIHDYSFDLTTEIHTPQGVAQLTSRAFFIYPDAVRQEINTPQGKAVIVFDGERGWQHGDAGRRDLSDQAAKQIRAEMDRNNLLIGTLPDQAFVRYTGREEVAGRPVDVVQIADVGGALVRLSIDAETHDVLKHTFVGDTPQGLAQVEEIFSDFGEAGGYRWYHHRKVLRNGEPALESTRSNLRVNVGYEETRLLADGPLR